MASAIYGISLSNHINTDTHTHTTERYICNRFDSDIAVCCRLRFVSAIDIYKTDENLMSYVVSAAGDSLRPHTQFLCNIYSVWRLSRAGCK